MNTNFATRRDVAEEAARYLGEYDRAGVILSAEALEEVASRAAKRWVAGHGYGPVSDEALDALYRLTEEEAAEYARPFVRVDGVALGPCIARDIEQGYVYRAKPVLTEAQRVGSWRYDVTVWADGSATLEARDRDCPQDSWWEYPLGPNEDIRDFEGVPADVLERLATEVRRARDRIERGGRRTS